MLRHITANIPLIGNTTHTLLRLVDGVWEPVRWTPTQAETVVEWMQHMTDTEGVLGVEYIPQEELASRRLECSEVFMIRGVRGWQLPVAVKEIS